MDAFAMAWNEKKRMRGDPIENCVPFVRAKSKVDTTCLDGGLKLTNLSRGLARGMPLCCKESKAPDMEQPHIFQGPRGGRFVKVVGTGEKVYVPLATTHWTKEHNGRWRLWLRDGRNMLLPRLQDT
jgi:hypothetical protein